jgi:hypothetical protein
VLLRREQSRAPPTQTLGCDRTATDQQTGLIEETTDQRSRQDNERRRYYQLTASGRVAAIDELTRLQHLVQRTAGHLGAAPT